MDQTSSNLFVILKKKLSYHQNISYQLILDWKKRPFLNIEIQGSWVDNEKSRHNYLIFCIKLHNSCQ